MTTHKITEKKQQKSEHTRTIFGFTVVTRDVYVSCTGGKPIWSSAVQRVGECTWKLDSSYTNTKCYVCTLHHKPFASHFRKLLCFFRFEKKLPSCSAVKYRPESIGCKVLKMRKSLNFSKLSRRWNCYMVENQLMNNSLIKSHNKDLFKKLKLSTRQKKSITLAVCRLTLTLHFWHHGTNSGYSETLATTSNISSAVKL